MWEEVPKENPSVPVDHHHTLSHTATDDHGDWILVASVIASALSTALHGQLFNVFIKTFIEHVLTWKYRPYPGC